ncbi:MAG: DNA-formamidopyrimidine glycosylase [Candidatus Eisenbacteria bacterium]|uniref:DNA-formamidopyrimidine glycosylase n=1 Tax=Eiseniibacteriota bacterium TaxID=2212470 RepID=A0A948RTF3_UNCEI|nr:DNA-formamidopyrimidine glycosylase [Candidatus Eisenbacteria bacterium]MBU2690231.1 DNA-formamidopyrimidine glycosylase [Candidatus Eisenbacteria bacterium]
MPELPEVETVVRDLQKAGLAGRAIRKVVVQWARSIDALTPRNFAKRVCGQSIVNISRRGKFIILELSDGQFLLIHLRMTGRLIIGGNVEREKDYERVALLLDDGRWLQFLDTRKFGRWCLVNSLEERLGMLGPEPLSTAFTSRLLTQKLADHQRMLKPLLLDQRFLAGLGNIYVDEALWDAQLHPMRLSSSLSLSESGQLYRSIRKVLRRGIHSQGTSLGDGQTNFYSVAGRRGRNQDRLRVFRKAGAACPRCGDGIIERIVVGQRGTHICSSCQKI